MLDALTSIKAAREDFKPVHGDLLRMTGRLQERAITAGHDHTCRVWKIPEESQLIFRSHAPAVDCVRYITPTQVRLAGVWLLSNDPGEHSSLMLMVACHALAIYWAHESLALRQLHAPSQAP